MQSRTCILWSMTVTSWPQTPRVRTFDQLSTSSLNAPETKYVTPFPEHLDLVLLSGRRFDLPSQQERTPRLKQWAEKDGGVWLLYQLPILHLSGKEWRPTAGLAMYVVKYNRLVVPDENSGFRMPTHVNMQELGVCCSPRLKVLRQKDDAAKVKSNDNAYVSLCT